METIKAIQTEYEGIRYRSRNEARWAVFFDCLGLDFEYEPEGYEIIHDNKKIRYAPDFLIKKQLKFDQNLYVEIKPSENGNIIITKDDEEKVFEFGMHYPITTLGSVGDYIDEINNIGGTNYEYMGDYGYLFCQCVHCGCFGFQFNGRSERICCCKKNTGHKNYNFDSQMILSALKYARSYRFWR